VALTASRIRVGHLTSPAMWTRETVVIRTEFQRCCFGSRRHVSTHEASRLCVDQAVKPRSEALNSLRARERRLFADRQIGDAESAHPNTHPFGEYVNSSRVKG